MKILLRFARFSLSIWVFVFFGCALVQEDSSNSNDVKNELAQAVTVNSLNQTPNCGTVKGQLTASKNFTSTLLSNTASDIIYIGSEIENQATIRAIPSNWDISIERINPANCEILATENSFQGSGAEEMDVVSLEGIRRAIRIKSGDGGGSGNYSLEVK